MKKINFIVFLVALVCCGNQDVIAQINDLKVAAYTFSIKPRAGAPTSSRTGHKIEKVYGNLKSTLFLFSQGNDKLGLLTSSFSVHAGGLNEVCVKELSGILNIPEEAIVANSSHNHTVSFIDVSDKERPQEGSPALISWELGREFLTGLRKAADHVADNLTPVTVEWGVAEENRITYNRKGVRPDGSTYFMREEDRLEIAGEGYHGLIDPDATVVVFKDYKGNPVSALTFFTGHPVAAYNPEKMITYGQFPQAACEILSDHLGGIPVGFVQGCAGNINSKHMLTGTIEQAEQLGQCLGESFIVAAGSLRPSKRIGLEWSREMTYIPLSRLPGEARLQKDLDSIDDFIRRGNAGDENTYQCVGMNFPRNLTPPYRAKLVELVRPWYVWALEQHKTNNLNNIPEHLPVEIVIARFGDVGFVGLPAESFVETGLKIKRESDLPCVLTCGYTDGSYGYIPDAGGVDDREYMSGFFRYWGANYQRDKNSKWSWEIPQKTYSTQFIPPYKAPAGDACADVAIKKIAEFAR